MRFQVPQFIEIEDKIFGPLTLKQFIYAAGGVAVGVLAFMILPKFIAIIISAPFVGLGLALAFYKPNNRPFAFTLEAMWDYFTGEKLYIWKKVPKPPKARQANNPEAGEENIDSALFQLPHISQSKLKDLNWNLDVKKGGEQDKTSGI
jgi:hypothetical protein